MKPGNVTFEQAASANVAGLTALQGLRDQGKIQPGSKVLINGAAGGVGTFAVQIAKSFGAEVTASAVRGIWIWSDQSALMKSLITLERISLRAINATI